MPHRNALCPVLFSLVNDVVEIVTDRIHQEFAVQVKVEIAGFAASVDLGNDWNSEAIVPGLVLVAQITEIVLHVCVHPCHRVKVLNLLLHMRFSFRKGLQKTLVAGGLGRPEGLNRGYYVRPTIFANVTNDMTIAREEIFGPVLSILPYDTEADAIKQANDTVYGLSGYVQSGNIEHARKVAAQLRTGNVHLNGTGGGMDTPVGGYKQSGTGREWGEFGFEEFLEVKAVTGYEAA